MQLFSRSEIQKTEVSKKKKNKKASFENENRDEESEKQINTIEKSNEQESETTPENITITTENKKKNKKKKKKKPNKPAMATETVTIPSNRKRKLEVKDVVNEKRSKVGSDKNQSLQFKKKGLRNKSLKPIEKSKEESSLGNMSDARLLAYGIKPKKFRNKLKYNKS